MKKVLYIYASPLMTNPKGSSCTEALNLFKKEYEKLNPTHESIILDLNKDPIGQASLTAHNFEAFFNCGKSDKHIQQLKSIDKVVIASPMINFNYPSTLKNYLDRILVANKTFRYKYDGKGESEGLLKNLKVQLLMSQGATLG
jgi:FMN-dependent NADH-azoreductase